MKRSLWLFAWVFVIFAGATALTACGPNENTPTFDHVIPVTGGDMPGAVTPAAVMPTAVTPTVSLPSVEPSPAPVMEQAAAPTALPSPTAAAPLPPPADPGASWQPDHSAKIGQNHPPEKRILVDISEQRVYAYQNGTAVMDFPVSTGRNNNTAVGTFKILDKKAYPYSEPWGFWMPNWMGIYWVAGLENGFHALPVLESGGELWRDEIGTPASYGCVVLLPEDMQRLYEWSEVGTPVEIVE